LTIAHPGSGSAALSSNEPVERGSEGFEVQRRIKAKGYSPGNVDGYCGDVMKNYVLKFKAANNLSDTSNIN
jgi:peptidoglycan hydrolase-like protein with peptidoglycan-binding domain